ncbi:TetR/AcrR family transcriptional regulator [Microbacterium sp. A93]|uniref:TetR/AcrR family transcriptional regulator n=1 Tax=Microbacterium sp. A93 TaxID=3450716 RepID=UPI003F4283F4
MATTIDSAPAKAPAEAARAARSDARTRQLLAAAARLMERSGSHSVSMQSVAAEAGVSVGLIYRYFASKEELVQAVIVGVLDDMSRSLDEAVGMDGDPVRRVASAFAAYCSVIRDNLQAVLLTYRESNTLGKEGRRMIKELEIQTAQPLRESVQDAKDRGLLRDLDVQLYSYDLLMVAHSWALKNWYFAPLMSFEGFVRNQTAHLLSAALHPDRRQDYSDLLGDLA